MKGGLLRIRKVETDFSLALLQSSLRAFSDMNIKKYLNYCAEVMNKTELVDSTVHHLCCAHMIKDFSRCVKRFVPELKKSDRQLALQCFALLQNCTEITEAKKIYHDICVVFFSSPSTETYSQSVNSLTKLAEGLSIEDVSEDDDYEDDVTESILKADYESLDEKTIKESSPFTIVFSKVVEVVDAKTIKSPECVMKRDVVFKCFEKFMYIFPLWSGVMLKKCGFPQTRDSNFPAEVWFKVLKNDISVPQRSRPGKFVIGIKQLIDARFKEHLYPKCRQPKSKRKKNNDQQKLILEEEKWQRKKAKSRKYQPPTKSTKQKGKVLPSVMKWGGKSVGVFLSNTCTIDNGLTILHIAFKENVNFNEAIQNEKDSILSRELLTIFKLMDDTHYSDAKKTWINFIKSNTSDDDPKKKTVANLFGDEFDFFISHLEKPWVWDVVSTCSTSYIKEILILAMCKCNLSLSYKIIIRFIHASCLPFKYRLKSLRLVNWFISQDWTDRQTDRQTVYSDLYISTSS
ncbi:hypothetical protein DPMN_006346 [Dreissena polymorpha]|uniref:Uncharacterized protein n=1 Tax=Dreissena polymorpha TaxID=45954 RepID=A0A9D4MRS7_DREPO|nr:hypothetical protein DPMN_006346 [Dreissena polymorpha]